MILFSEKQKFRQWWIWPPILLCPFVLFIIRNYQESHVSQLDFKQIDLFGFIPVLITFLVFWLVSLKTEITTEGILVQVNPFHAMTKFFPWHDIESILVREYKPLFEEYGNWGMRSTFCEQGIAYWFSGKMVIHLKFKNSDKGVLIGTQRPEYAKVAIQNASKLKIEDIK